MKIELDTKILLVENAITNIRSSFWRNINHTLRKVLEDKCIFKKTTDIQFYYIKASKCSHTLYYLCDYAHMHTPVVLQCTLLHGVLFFLITK